MAREHVRKNMSIGVGLEVTPGTEVAPTTFFPFMGDMGLNDVTTDTLENLRLHIVEDRKLSLKTARNIIDGSLRAMIRDAGRRIDRNPFNDLPANWWPRLPQREPDPFTEEGQVAKVLSVIPEKCTACRACESPSGSPAVQSWMVS